MDKSLKQPLLNEGGQSDSWVASSLTLQQRIDKASAGLHVALIGLGTMDSLAPLVSIAEEL